MSWCSLTFCVAMATVCMYGGAVKTVDEQCNDATKTDFGFSLKDTDYRYFCLEMACITEINDKYDYYDVKKVKPAEHTQCGNKQWCEGRRCVRNDNAPPVIDSRCPWGKNASVCHHPQTTCRDTSLTFCCAKCRKD